MAMGEFSAAFGGLTLVVIWVSVFLVLCAGGTVLALKWDAWFSKKAGATGVVVQNNNSSNQIQEHQEFDQLYGEIQQYRLDMKGDPLDSSAAQQACVQAVSKYDTLADGLTSRDWRPSADPTSIPYTVCNP